MDEVPGWVAILLAFGGMIGGGFGAFLLSVYQTRNKNQLDQNKQANDNKMTEQKQTSELKISENEQAFKIYKDLVDILREDVTKMTEDMKRLEIEHLKCREENAAGRAEAKARDNRILDLESQIVYLKTKIGP